MKFSSVSHDLDFYLPCTYPLMSPFCTNFRESELLPPGYHIPHYSFESPLCVQPLLLACFFCISEPFILRLLALISPDRSLPLLTYTITLCRFLFNSYFFYFCEKTFLPRIPTSDCFFSSISTLLCVFATLLFPDPKAPPSMVPGLLTRTFLEGAESPLHKSCGIFCNPAPPSENGYFLSEPSLPTYVYRPKIRI